MSAGVKFRNDHCRAMHACNILRRTTGRQTEPLQSAGEAILYCVESHRSVPGAVICGLVYAALAFVVNWSLRRERRLPYADLALFCLCKLQILSKICRSACSRFRMQPSSILTGCESLCSKAFTMVASFCWWSCCTRPSGGGERVSLLAELLDNHQICYCCERH